MLSKCKKTLIYFAIFGFVFGLFNVVDIRFGLTGGRDIPISWAFNIPALVAQTSIVEPVMNSIGKLRYGSGIHKESLSREELEELSLKEQEEHTTGAVKTKERGRQDILAGEKGILIFLHQSFLFFPLTSTFAWFIIGLLLCTLKRIFKVLRKGSNSVHGSQHY